MPVGVMLDGTCVLIGGVLGAAIRNRVPHKVKEPLNLAFGICAIGIGLISFLKLQSLSVVILTLLSGTVLGELLNLDRHVRQLFRKIFDQFHFKIDGDRESYMDFFVIVAVTFCASGTNIFGALYEGATGDYTILLSKAAMDILL